MAELDRYRTIYVPAYEDGHLLVGGGTSRQPARYLDLVLAMRATDHLLQAKYDTVTAADSQGDE